MDGFYVNTFCHTFKFFHPPTKEEILTVAGEHCLNNAILLDRKTARRITSLPDPSVKTIEMVIDFYYKEKDVKSEMEKSVERVNLNLDEERIYTLEEACEKSGFCPFWLNELFVYTLQFENAKFPRIQF